MNNVKDEKISLCFDAIWSFEMSWSLIQFRSLVFFCEQVFVVEILWSFIRRMQFSFFVCSISGFICLTVVIEFWNKASQSEPIILCRIQLFIHFADILVAAK